MVFKFLRLISKICSALPYFLSFEPRPLQPHTDLLSRPLRIHLHPEQMNVTERTGVPPAASRGSEEYTWITRTHGVGLRRAGA